MTDQIDHELFYELQIAANRQTLWIHYSGDGSTVARFSPRGVDLHNTVSEQMAGAQECRLCTHGSPSKFEWQMFREKAKEWWGVDVPDDAIDTSFLLPG
ncbi:TPA: hypothetical protein ACNV18_000031 [Pseudomonas putida]|jgi:hypothetical protein|uniref:hypothetical protein n=1 Tax=Pseudomonas TaxID=286 RepID=UPI000D8DC712|nr:MULTISPECIES: hypothetical protein [Pseudomonas]MCE0946138.1 hypothetical protein [Pseudomonas asiatica]MCE1004750.1 hypothetical protein [Pseudomonas sp. NMI1173_11]MCE1066975.1 hypothetical protein [Pseudomonas asiatica]PYD14516.1 hypothetical protein DND47_16710 [Pseudomonas syringae pv. syringae]